MKLSDYIIDLLVSKGVTHVFEICGGALAHLIDSMYEREDIQAISMHHEMAAAIAAEGYARVSGNFGVSMATSGPGATNLITGIGSCFFDSIPCLFITGQVNTYEFKFDKSVRQIGFQETDIVNIVKPIVKDAILVTDEHKAKQILEGSIKKVRSGRPGPVLIDIPMNIQRADIEIEDSIDDYKTQENNSCDDEIVEKYLKLLNTSERPVVLVGGGIRLSKSDSQLIEFINKTNILVVTSLMGLDAFPHEHESFVGMIGTYGNRYANLALANADLLLVLGSRLDTRQTGTNPDTFAREATIFHVDVDSDELNNKIMADYTIKADLKDFLVVLNNKINTYNKNKFEKWHFTVKSFKNTYPSFEEPKTNNIDPNFFMHELSKVLPENAVICVDVGQNQMWAAQSIEIKENQRFLTQGGMASIGSALPLGIGASFAKPSAPIVVITGDGGFQLNIQELQTIYHHNLPIKIIMLNNQCYGMIRQFQEQYFDCRFQSTSIGYSCPDFQDVVSAYKIPSIKINKINEIQTAFESLFQDRAPMFLEVDIKQSNKAFPKLSVDRPIEDQEPLLSTEELKSNMLIDVIRRNEINEDG